MDARLEKALEFSKFRHSQYLEKRRLQEKLQADLTIAHNGGLFTIDRTLIVFLNQVTPEAGTGSITLLDNNLVPVLIADLVAFRRDVLDKYTKVIAQYYVDYERLRRARTPQALFDL